MGRHGSWHVSDLLRRAVERSGYLQHWGGSLSARKPDQGQDRFRARGDLRDGPPSILNTNYLDTGSFDTKFQYECNLEHITIYGPFEVQAEYLVTWLQDCTINPLQVSNSGLPPAQAGLIGHSQNTLFQGGYCEMLYFLTGESRPYDRRMGVVDRIIPYDNFFWTRRKDGGGCGWGAWQVGARYSYTNVNSGGINGGILNAMTYGINWFLNPNLKLQFNYDIDYRSQVLNTAPGWINAAGCRLAFDW